MYLPYAKGPQIFHVRKRSTFCELENGGEDRQELPPCKKHLQKFRHLHRQQELLPGSRESALSEEKNQCRQDGGGNHIPFFCIKVATGPGSRIVTSIKSQLKA